MARGWLPVHDGRVDAVEDLRRLISGAQVSQAISTAAGLGISDHLAEAPLDTATLAARTSCHEPTLYRLLRALATVGVYEERPDRVFALTPLGEVLRTDVPESLAAWAQLVATPAVRRAWEALGHSVRTGQSAFPSVHGMSVWAYRAAHPEENALFDAAMTSVSQTAARGVLAGYDFGRFGTVADIGGGHGALLGAVLLHYPHLRGVLADQEHVVSGAPKVLAALGVLDRCDVRAVDFFDSVPAGADAYLLKSVVHDWADDEAVALLRICRAAMGDDAVLLLVERVVGGPAEVAAAFSDLNMLVNPGGRERTQEEFDALLARAGFRPTRTIATSGAGFCVLEYVPTEAGTGAP